jgi:hypothetical protein
MIRIDEATYTACMFLVREARLKPPLLACPGVTNWRAVENQLRLAMMQAITDEVNQLTDGATA